MSSTRDIVEIALDYQNQKQLFVIPIPRRGFFLFRALNASKNYFTFFSNSFAIAAA